MGLIAIHELQHRTVFRTRWINDFFERLYAFISWSDYIWYQESHAIHHRATCHQEYDGEVLLPIRFSLSDDGEFGSVCWHGTLKQHGIASSWYGVMQTVVCRASGISTYYQNRIDAYELAIETWAQEYCLSVTSLLGHRFLSQQVIGS